MRGAGGTKAFPGMDAKEHLQAGRLQEALASLQDAVRKAPANVSLRLLLFELQCVLGEWEKAVRQLQVMGELDAEYLLFSQGFRAAIQCEVLRSEVFSGNRTPLIFGEPEPWMSWLVQANHLVAKGQIEASRELREKALEEAPTSVGKINGEPFAWLADSDSRLGPMLEVMIEGKYYWVPFVRITAIELETPKSLRDLIWIGGRFTWSNGGDAAGLIPVRYPETERAEDSAFKLSRKTEWKKLAEDLFTGNGQRMLTTDQADYPLLEVRRIELDQLPESGAASPAVPTE